MSRFEFTCPSCGAKVSFETSISPTAVCAYCRSMCMRDDQGIKDLGKVGQLLQDASPIQIGSTGTYDGAKFTAVGRVQMSYDQGVWNEWFLGFDDGRTGWLGEAQGLYGVAFKTKEQEPLPPFKALEVEQAVGINGVAYTVRDKRAAKYAAAEGQLPFTAPISAENEFVDLGGENAEFATIDYSEDPPVLFAGFYRDFAAFGFENLRKFDGW